jgi:hypothetical protein
MRSPTSITTLIVSTMLASSFVSRARAQDPGPEAERAPRGDSDTPSTTEPSAGDPNDSRFAQAAPPDSPNLPKASESPAGAPVAGSDDLAEIEAALAADQAANDESAEDLPAEAAASPVASSSGTANMNPDLALILDTAFAYFSEDENLQSGAHDPTVTGFNFQQLELSAGASVDPYLRFDANVVFSQHGAEVEEAYGTTLALPARFQARFGQFLHRFGRINPTHPHSWDFVDQPFAVGRVFGPEGGRGLGVEVSWLAPLPWYVELVGSAMQADGEGMRSFFDDESPGVEDPLDLLYVTAVEQFFALSDDWSLLWGMSSALGPNPTGRDSRTDVLGTDLYVKYRPVTRASHFSVAWQSEVFYRRREIPNELLQDVNLYTQLVFGLTQRWGLAGRYELGSPARTTSDDGTPLDPLDPEWSRDRHRISANLTFWPTEFSRFRLQSSYDLPRWLDRGVWSAFLAAELVAGAHGTHKF